jgi:hypothetical protein
LLALRRHESEKIWPVAVVRYEFTVARLVVRVVILVSCTVFVPWSFWIAESRESAAVTVHDDPAT